jgi:ABC-type amino acid transport substrate-binding protein
MGRMKAKLAAAILTLLPLPALSAPQELIFAAPMNHTMPFAQFNDGELTGGILKDIGIVLAERMGRKAKFVALPSKRVPVVLAKGEVDGLCFLIPGWIDVPLNWTRPAIPAAAAVAANSAYPVIHSLADLAGERTGTTLGYRYVELESVLGPKFIRDDAPSALHNLNKLAAGRNKYALIDLMTLEYFKKLDRNMPVRIDHVYLRFKASCAFARSSSVKIAEADRALGSMADDGTIDAIFARYR